MHQEEETAGRALSRDQSPSKGFSSDWHASFLYPSHTRVPATYVLLKRLKALVNIWWVSHRCTSHVVSLHYGTYSYMGFVWLSNNIQGLETWWSTCVTLRRGHQQQQPRKWAALRNEWPLNVHNALHHSKNVTSESLNTESSHYWEATALESSHPSLLQAEWLSMTSGWNHDASSSFKCSDTKLGHRVRIPESFSWVNWVSLLYWHGVDGLGILFSRWENLYCWTLAILYL